MGRRNERLLRAHRLAHTIMWAQAREVASKSKTNKEASDYFDPGAATELGELIYNTMCRPAPQ